MKNFAPRGLLASLMASFFAGMPSLFSTYGPPGAGLLQGPVGKRSRTPGPRRPAGSKLARLAGKSLIGKCRIR